MFNFRRWTKQPQQQWLDYIAIGFANTLFGYGLYCGFIYIHIHYLLAVLLANVFGILFNYYTFSKWVFKSKPGLRFFLRFVQNYAFLYFMNVSMIAGFAACGVNLYLAGIFSTAVCAILGFFLHSNRVFIKP